MKTNDSQPMVSQELPYVVTGRRREWIINAINSLAGIDDPGALRAALEELVRENGLYREDHHYRESIEPIIDRIDALLPKDTCAKELKG